jgi:hypothetical protein
MGKWQNGEMGRSRRGDGVAEEMPRCKRGSTSGASDEMFFHERIVYSPIFCLFFRLSLILIWVVYAVFSNEANCPYFVRENNS